MIYRTGRAVTDVERAADKLLAANPSVEYPFLSADQLQRIAHHEHPLDPSMIEDANAIIPREQQVNQLLQRERERKRRGNSAQKHKQIDLFNGESFEGSLKPYNDEGEYDDCHNRNAAR